METNPGPEFDAQSAAWTDANSFDGENDRPAKRAKRANSITTVRLQTGQEDPQQIVVAKKNVPLNLASQPRSRYLILHNVQCSGAITASEDHSKHLDSSYFLDTPRMYAKDSRGSALRGMHQVTDVEEYLESRQDICLIVYKTYDCTRYLQEIRDQFDKLAPESMNHSVFLEFRPWFYSLKNDAAPAKALAEYIQVVSSRLEKGLTKLTLSDPDTYSAWQDSKNLAAPYDYFYHHQASLRIISPQLLDAQSQEELLVLLDFIQASHGSEYDEADHLFSEGYVSKRVFTRLFRAHEIIVGNVEGGAQAYMIEKYEGSPGKTVDLACWYWGFNGDFQRTKVQISVNWPNENDDIVPVTSLKVWPLRLDKTDILEHLEERGSRFWECRRRKLVRYASPVTDTFEIHSVHM